jgi:hypothetical protein
MKLVIEGVGKLYRGKVWGLRDFSLELGPGVLGLLGPNAATCGHTERLANSRRRCGYAANDWTDALPRSIQTLICTCTPCGARVMFMGCAISRVVHLDIAQDDTVGSPFLLSTHPSRIHQHTLQPSRQK